MNNKEHPKHITADEVRLTQALDALARDIAPERDLWPELAQRLPEQNRTSTSPRWAAAAALAAIALSFWLIPSPPPEPVATTTPINSTAASLAVMYEQEKTTQMAMLSGVNPNIDRQLAIWDDAIEQVENALQYYPDQTQLLQQLNRLYQQQLHYLAGLSRLPPQVIALY